MRPSHNTQNKTVKKKCKIKGCEQAARALLFCPSHYYRYKNNLNLSDPIGSRFHGKQKSKEYSSWNNMRMRCLNPKNKNYDNYGARGIKVCKRWDSFLLFLEDMGPKPEGKYSIERRNNSKGYSKNNCYWATDKEQARNQRNNVLDIEKAREIRNLYSSKKYSQKEIGKIFGISRDVVGYVVRGQTWKE